MSKTLTDEYFEHYAAMVKEYTSKVCVLMQIGSFYEIQGLEGEGNIFEVAKVLNIQVTKKNKSVAAVDRSNPYMAGFPKPAVVKYLPVLLDAGWTVAIYDQDDTGTKVKRYLKGIYSRSIPMLIEGDANVLTSRDNNDLVSVYLQVKTPRRKTHANMQNITYAGYSVARVNTGTNDFMVDEKNLANTSVEDIIDSLSSAIVKCEPGEILFMYDDNLLRTNDNNTESSINTNTEGSSAEAQILNKIQEYLASFEVPVRMLPVSSDWRDLNFCNEYLRKVYKTFEFGMLTPVEYFNMEMCVLSATNVVGMLEFIRRHDRKYLENVSEPVMNGDENFVHLHSNTLEQLNVIRSKGGGMSLFDVLNKTRTSIGKRGLRALLCRPYCKVEDIRRRLSLSEVISGAYPNQQRLEEILDGILDITYLHRRMSLGMITPKQFGGLLVSYEKIVELHDELHTTSGQDVASFVLTDEERGHTLKFLEECRELLDVDDNGCGITFRKGHIKQMDEINEKVKACEEELEKIRSDLDSKFTSRKGGEQWVKLGYLESEGHFFTTTKLRWAVIKGSVELPGLSVKGNTNNNIKITTKKSKEISQELSNNVVLLEEKFKLHWIKTMNGLVESYRCLFQPLAEFVERIDISVSNVRCKREYGYCCPIIADGDTIDDGSYISAKGMRHPIIERIKTDTEYIPNDITIDNKHNGIVLYALNSCGKSSLLRSVGMNVIMAQCGFYVACSQFVFCPFRTIVSQVDMSDNLWKGQSSFVSEMIGLRKIMQTADEYTLVLSDELTKGTEVVSATSIFSAAVLELIERNTKFLFTTHLQGVAKLEEIKTCEKLQIFHLSVEFEDTDDGTVILFRRKLEPGPSSELYGLEVARSIGLSGKFMETSFKIRDRILGQSNEVLSSTRSRYNKRKILDKCEICGYRPYNKTDIWLDTHHIKAQCSADDNNFTGHFHKDSKFNLVSLCKRCHVDVHGGKIDIEGFVDTSSGKVLKYRYIK